MAQSSWFYTFPNGKKYEIGIFHGDDEGNVVIYCEGKIMVIDFSVKESKDYSFFIENILLKISIEKNHGTSFSYFLTDEKIHPPYVEQKEKGKNYWVVVISVFVIAFLILLVWIFSFSKNLAW